MGGMCLSKALAKAMIEFAYARDTSSDRLSSMNKILVTAIGAFATI